MEAYIVFDLNEYRAELGVLAVFNSEEDANKYMIDMHTIHGLSTHMIKRTINEQSTKYPLPNAYRWRYEVRQGQATGRDSF